MSSNKWKKFSTETLQRLFIAIDEDDIVDEHTDLPPVVELQCPEDKIRDNYALCLQHWEDGFTRDELLRLVNKLLDGGDLSAEERKEYKYIRSRYKHLRFAQRLYGQKHESSFWFSKTTVFLGHFQDAFRNEKKDRVRLFGRILRFCLSKPIWNCVEHSLRDMVIATEAGFVADRQQQIAKLRALIGKPMLTGTEFHDVRKIISQQVSYYDTLRSIDPADQDALTISRFLAAINGIMGDKHDEMVADNMEGRKPYNEPTQLEPDLRQRLDLLISRYPA